MKADELITLIQNSEEEVSTIETLNDLIDKKLSTEEVTEETAEEVVEETTEEAAEETTEETVEETTEETSEETTEETEEAPAEGENEINLSTIMTIIGDLRAENESLRTQLADVQAQLSASKKAEKDFIEKFKNLSVSIREEKKPEKPAEKHHQFGMTNGIGEL